MKREAGRFLASRSWIEIPVLLLVMVVPLSSGGEAGAEAQPWESQKKVVQEMVDQRRFADAEAPARSLIGRAEREHGPSSARAAEAIDLLVKVLIETRQGRLPETRALAERAIAIKERQLGPDHLELAVSLNNLGRLLLFTEGAAAARPWFERLVGVRERNLGPDDPAVARALNNLAVSLKELGEYATARKALERSLRILEQRVGPDHGDVMGVRNSLASLLRHMGEAEAALREFERQREVHIRQRGPDSPDAMGMLHNAANALRDLGRFEEARRGYAQVIDWEEAQPGSQHKPRDTVLKNMAIVLGRLGEWEQARSFAERSLATIQGSLAGAPENAQAAEVRGFIAECLVRTGRAGDAREHLERAVTTQRTLFGPNHPSLADTLSVQALMLWTLGERAGAIETAVQVEEMARRHFLETAGSLTEREALLFEGVRDRGQDLVLSALASAEGAGVGRLDARAAWDQVVRSRAIVLDVIASRRRESHLDVRAEVAELVASARSLRQRLSRLLVMGSEAGSAERYAAQLAELRAELGTAERAIAERSAPLGREMERARIGVAEVLDGLPSDSALVAYVLYDRLAGESPGRAGPVPDPARSARPSYLAFVAARGSASLRFVDLGGAAEIDALIEAYAAAAGARPGGGADVEAPPREASAPGGGRDGSPDDAGSGELVRRRLWDPVAGSLGAARLVFVVPDGSIHRLNFATLPSEPGRYLLETGPLLHRLSAERDLVLVRGARPAGKGLFVLGGPDYDGRAVPEVVAGGEARASSAAAAPGAQASPRKLHRSAPAACGEMRSLRFKALAGARQEAEEVASLWREERKPARDREGVPGDALLMTGAAASEAAFKRWAPGRRVLHIATHGFFMLQPCGVGGPVTPAALGRNTVARRSGDDFMHLCGLALAGANRRHEVALDGPEEDGILTSEEIVSVDLSGVEWAVLSACDTGAGAIRAGEGVLGLGRAFEIAGASTIILSLWEIEDDAARAWMRHLYRGRTAGLSTAESVRRASLDLLDGQRRLGRSTHPFFWGSFIAVGDWR